MIYLLDTNQDYNELERDLEAEVGQLITPLTRFRNQERRVFAIDNGAYSRFDRQGFLSLLERERDNRERCRFVVVPDVVGSARRTLEAFDEWYPRLHGWKIALACQDGQEDFPIRWDLIDAVFIGGSTEWKVSESAKQIVKCAQLLGKWTHMGRVNSASRIRLAENWGVNSCDGTGLLFREHRERVIMRLKEKDYMSRISPTLWEEIEKDEVESRVDILRGDLTR